MASLFVLLVVVSIAGAIGFYYIPWAGRLFALYALHGTRDRVYAIGEQIPAVRGTVLYQDVLRILCTMIYVVRARPLRDVATFWSVLSRARTKPHASSRDRYAHDLDRVFVGQEGLRALGELLELTATAELALFLRVASGHPLLLACVCTVGSMAWIARRLMDLVDRLSRAFESRSRPPATMARFGARLDAVAKGARRLRVPFNDPLREHAGNGNGAAHVS